MTEWREVVVAMHARRSPRVLERSQEADPPDTPRTIDEPLSPELALVDPDLAACARRALPEIVLTETRLEASRKTRLRLLAAARRIDATGSVEPSPYQDIFRLVEALANEAPPPTRLRLRWIGVAGVVAVGVAGIALVAHLYTLRPSSETRAHGTTSGLAAPIVSVKAAGRRPAPVDAHAFEATARRGVATPFSSSRTPPQRIPSFVWVRDEQAHGYAVEFRAGSKVVYRTRTRTEHLRVTPSVLRPGKYRWIVWRLNRKGRRIAAPLVDSQLTIR